MRPEPHGRNEQQDGPLLLRCTWCDRITVGEEWLEGEDIQNRQAPLSYRLTHGVCPDCFTRRRTDTIRRHLDR